MDHCILLLQHLSNNMHFITNGHKRFSKTNSTNPRQRVPLMTCFLLGVFLRVIVIYRFYVGISVFISHQLCLMMLFHVSVPAIFIIFMGRLNMKITLYDQIERGNVYSIDFILTGSGHYR